MGSAIVDSGVCGFRSEVCVASQDGAGVRITITSQCANITRLADALDGRILDGFQEVIRPRDENGDTPLQGLFRKTIPHPGCPVYSGIVKAIEVTLGMALPADAHIRISGR